MSLEEDLGYVRKGVENLEKGQEKLGNSVSDLHQTVTGLVRQGDCVAYRESLREELTDDLTPPPIAPETTGEHLISQPPPGRWPPEALSLGLLERMGNKAKNIAQIGGLLLMIGGSLYAVHVWVSKVENKLAASDKKASATRKKMQKQILKKIKVRNAPHVIYVPVAAPRDAGTTWRPRPRRRRRVP